MFKRTSFAEVFEHSGLTKAELASLYGVSRQTIYDWYTGASSPSQCALVAREELYTRGLLAAIKQGVLPIREVKDARVRKARVLAMAQALHALAKPK